MWIQIKKEIIGTYILLFITFHLPTRFCHKITAMVGSAHGSVIYNGLSQRPRSNALTWWNPKGGASTVDNLMGSPSLTPEISKFAISSRFIGLAADHAYLRSKVKGGCTRNVYAKESGLAKHQFTRETFDVYSCGVYNGILDLDHFTPPRGSYTRTRIV